MYKVVGKRLMAVVLSVCMVLGMSDLSMLVVDAAQTKLKDASVILEYVEYTYDRQAAKPSVTAVELDGTVLEENTHYTVVYATDPTASVTVDGDLVDAGTKYAIIEGMGVYSGESIHRRYTVLSKSISTIEQSITGSVKCNGNNPVEPGVTLSYNGIPLIGESAPDEFTAIGNGYDYYYQCLLNDRVGTATITIYGCGNYSDKISSTYNIVYKDFVTDATVDFDLETAGGSNASRRISYTRGERKPIVTVTDNELSPAPLDPSLYEVEFLDEDGNVSDCIGAGEVTVRVTGKGDYSGAVAEYTYRIYKNLNVYMDDIVVEGHDGGFPFTGAAIEPDIKVYDTYTVNGVVKRKELAKGTDYDPVCTSNINVGTGQIQIKGKGVNYSSDKTVTFRISERSMNDVQVSITDSNIVYNGSQQTPNVTVTLDGNTLTSGTDYTLTYGTNKAAGENAGTITISPGSNGGLTGSRLIYFTIQQKSLEDTDGTISVSFTPSDSTIYTGSPVGVTATVKYKKLNGELIEDLVEGTDYTVSWSEDTKAGPVQVKITGKDNYTGTVNKDYRIDPVTLNDSNTTLEWENGDINYTPTYIGSEIRPNVIVKYNNATLSTGDYDVTYEKNIDVSYSGNTVVAGAIVKVTGKGNYEGTVTKTFTILAKDISDIPDNMNMIYCTLDNTSLIYTRAQIRPGVVLYYMPGVSLKTLTQNDYTLSYANNTNVAYDGNEDVTAAATVTVTGKGNYTGSRTIPFAVEPVDLNANKAKVRIVVQPGVGADTFYKYYNGAVVTPADIKVYYKFAEGDEKLLTAVGPMEYELSYTGATGIGKADVTVTGEGNYTGFVTAVGAYHIKADLIASYAGLSITTSTQTFTGSAITPDIEMSAYDKEFKKGVDYVLDYADHANPGVATVKIFAKDTSDYFISNPSAGGTDPDNGFYIARTFTIEKKALGDETTGAGKVEVILPENGEYTYTGLDIEPMPELKYGGNTYTLNSTDYTVSHSNNRAASANTAEGKATVTITANNSSAYFNGSIEADFIIKKRLLTNDTVNVNKLDEVGVNLQDYIYRGTDFTFSGLEITCEQTDPYSGIVTFNNNEIEYAVAYEKNDKVGVATLVITGSGNFGGEVRKTFILYGDLSDPNTVIAQISNQKYSGIGLEPALEVSYYGNDIFAGEDYQPAYTNNVNVNETPDVTINTGTSGYYINSQSTTFTIVQKDLQEACDEGLLDISGINAGGYPYNNGTSIIPQLTAVRYNNCVDLVEQGTVTVTPGVVTNEYALSYRNNINVPAEDAAISDLPTIIITAPSDSVNFTGFVEKTFTINPRDISAIAVTAEDNDGVIQDREIWYVNDLVGTSVTFETLKLYYDYTTDGGVKQELVIAGEGLTEADYDYTLSYQGNNKVGLASITVEGNGNYTGEKTFTFVLKGDLQDPATDVTGIETKPYNAIGATQDITVKYGIQGLAEGTDYKVSYRDNVDVAPENSTNPPTVIITGINYFAGSTKEIPFTITPCDLSSETDTAGITVEGLEDGFMYTGMPITPDNITLKNNGVPMENQYSITGYKNNTDAADKDSKNPPCIIIEGAGGNYIGTMEIPFTIKGIPINNGTMVNVEIDENQYYTGHVSDVKPEVTVTRIATDGSIITTLKKGEDYILDWKNFENAAGKNDGENAPAVIIIGINNYSERKNVNYNILPRDIKAYEDEFTVEITDQKYIGSEIIPPAESVKITDNKNGITLKAEDYKLSKGANCIAVGEEAKVTIEGMGNYKGTITGTFTIIRKDISESDIEITDVVDKTYNTKAQTQEPMISWNGTPLVKNQDYELSYNGNNTNAGPASVTITGTGNYEGSKTEYFTIAKRDLSGSEFTVADISSQPYTVAGVEPKPIVSYVDATEGIDCTLTLTNDYTLTYTGNGSVGVDIATVTITGTGNYEGIIEKTFTIGADIALASVEPIGAQPYTGSPLTPSPVITLAGKTLQEGDDYELEYTNNIEAGTATITISGTGDDYGGTKVVTFIINRDFSSEVSVTGLGTSYLYTGSAITPVPANITAFGITLRNGTDYKLSYSNNINAGKAKVTITGIGKYSGSKDIEFEIARRNVSQCTVSATTTFTYTGKTQSPAVTVKYGNTALSKGSEYAIVYVNNLTPGKAKVIISGTGANYTGSKVITFDIFLSKVSAKATPKNTAKIALSWSKSSGATGYEIFNTSNKRIARTTKTSYTISGLKAGTAYNYKVRAYVIKDGQYYYSDFTSVIKTATQPAKPAITLKSTKTKQAAVSWKSVSGASGYEVYRSTKKGSGYKKVTTTTKKTYTNKKLTSKKKYYYKVRAYKVVNGNKIYSSYSTPKYVTIK